MVFPIQSNRLVLLLPAVALLMVCQASFAQDSASVARLPEPLTLEQALSLADDARHPELAIVQADHDIAAAEVEQAEANTGLDVSLLGRLRFVQPPDISPDQSHDDHQLSLFVRKRLYDFGRTGSSVEAADADLKGQQWRLIDARNERRIEIMARYFDVLLADLKFARDNEEMATAYVSYDKAKDRNELGQLSDIVLLKTESYYQEVRHRRFESQANQRITRARLANALNRPDQLPATLVAPDLPGNDRNLPDVDELFSQAIDKNPMILALRERLRAGQERIDAARAEYLPTLDGELEVSRYSRKLGSYDDWRAGIVVDIPLYTGGRVSSSVLKERARMARIKALLNKQEMSIRQAVLETWSDLDTLRVEREEVRALHDYRELYLDRSRALYELEVKTDLGDAMVQTSEVRLRAASTEYRTALAWARLHALLGKPILKMQGPKQEQGGQP
jgi:outer membrane protein TolC